MIYRVIFITDSIKKLVFYEKLKNEMKLLKSFSLKFIRNKWILNSLGL